ncbi:hypothetical protein TrCOL_g9924 [Triparma columacea]|uniref:VOC domain-containing protein n=1 Tax=Triparma columacea TaxID=722753 RepID=A0A9W7G299_9STRA|nr:hypothetical protein TrCOL_g9924 [Triparma columacea]
MTTTTPSNLPTITLKPPGTPGLSLIEHVNLNVPPAPYPHPDLAFYNERLGLPLDVRKSMNVKIMGSKTVWVNIGCSQIHLPAGPVGQKLRGTIGLRCLDLPGFSRRVDVPITDGYVDLTSPSGQAFRVRECDPGQDDLLNFRGNMWTADSNLLPSSDEVHGRLEEDANLVGIDYLEMLVPTGKVGGVLKFYEDVFGCHAREIDVGVGVVSVGGVMDDGRSLQSLVFRESGDVEEYDGHHIAVYVAGGEMGFKDVFERCKQRGIVWVNERFSDKVEDWEGAKEEKQFRLKNVVDGWTLEHEVRCKGHKDSRAEVD